jgi:hypothetical protein
MKMLQSKQQQCEMWFATKKFVGLLMTLIFWFQGLANKFLYHSNRNVIPGFTIDAIESSESGYHHVK